MKLNYSPFVSGDLPQNLFSETGSESNSSSGGGGGKPKKVSVAEASQVSKNTTIEYCVLTEAYSNATNVLRDLNGQKRKSVRELINGPCGGDKRRGKEKIQRYHNSKQVTEFDSDFEDMPDSQESRLEEIYELQMDIEQQKDSIAVMKKRLQQKKKDM